MTTPATNSSQTLGDGAPMTRIDEAVVRELEARLGARQGAMRAALRELVEVNSFTQHVDGGARVGELLAAQLRGAGLEVSVLPSESGRFAPHIVARTPAAIRKGAPDVVLVGHLDTVFPPGTFEGYREEGELARGPGVLDMKGGLVLAIEALAAVLATVGAGAPAVAFAIVSDEEVGSPEGRPIIQRAAQGASAALVFEAGRAGDAIITRRKGTGSFTARARGVSAHAGAAHEKGKNAIWALARFVDEAQRLTDYTRGITVNVGKFTGGQSKNTVPDEAEALADFRFERVADGEDVMRALADAALRASSSVPGTSIELQGGIGRVPLERTDESAALFLEYAACARRAGLGDSEAPLIGGGSDASSTAALGIPSIDGLGPRGAGFHTRDERIEVATLVPKALALAFFLAGRGIAKHRSEREPT